MAAPQLLDKEREHDNNITIFQYNINNYSPAGQLLICCGGVMSFHMLYAYLQEGLYRFPGFNFGWFQTLVQFAIYTACAGLERTVMGISERRTPWREHATLSFFLVVSMGLSNWACEFLNYPTQVLFKSSKLIPVMLMGKSIQNRTYSGVEYIAACFLCIGLAVFTLGDSMVIPVFNTEGIVIICLALCADAFIGNLQERTMKEHGSSELELVFYTDLLGTAVLFLGLLASDQLKAALNYCAYNPMAASYMMLMGVVGYLGVLFVLATVRRFGALVSVVVTSSRKLLTMILSFMVFPKPFTWMYMVGGLLAFVGIFIHVYVKNKNAIRAIFGLEAIPTEKKKVGHA